MQLQKLYYFLKICLCKNNLNFRMLSEEKVKQQLQGLIKQIGLKDEVKKHLRIKLAERLQKSNQLPQFRVGSDHLRHRIISSLIKQHLDKIGCTYSSSVFAAESECDQKMLERVELVQLLSLPSAHQDLSLIEYVIQKSPGRTTLMRNTDMQTEEPQGHLSLQKKFTIIDLEFRRVLQENKIIAKPLKSHDCDLQKAWYQKELVKFRQFQSHKIKVKVGQQWRLKFQDYAQSMQSDYRKRIERLRNKEKTLTEQFISREKMFEQKTKGWQASAKSRLELVQLKENAVNRQKTSLQIQRNNVIQAGKKASSQAKQKQRQYQNLLLNVQKRIDYEVGVVRLSLEQAQNEKQQQFANRRKFVDEQYGKLMGIKDTLQLLKTQNQRLSKQNTALRDQCKKLRQQLRLAYGQNSAKSDRIDVLRDQLTDVKNTNKDFEIKFLDQQKLRKKRENEVTETRKELDQLRGKLLNQSSQSEIEIQPKRGINDIQMKMVKLREQRKKDIEKFKLQIQ